MGKPGAVAECVVVNGSKAVREAEVGKSGAVIECMGCNSGKAVRKDEVGKSGAVFEYFLFNAGHPCRYGHSIYLVFGDRGKHGWSNSLGVC